MKHTKGGFSDFQPKRGGMEITTDSIHTLAIMRPILLGVRFIAYWNGRVITKYRSTLIIHRFKIEAVHKITSSDVKISHTISPRGQWPAASLVAANGMTKTATNKSETARDKISRLDGVWSRLTNATAMQTKELPMIVPIIIKMRKNSMKACSTGVYGDSGAWGAVSWGTAAGVVLTFRTLTLEREYPADELVSMEGNVKSSIPILYWCLTIYNPESIRLEIFRASVLDFHSCFTVFTNLTSCMFLGELFHSKKLRLGPLGLKCCVMASRTVSKEYNCLLKSIQGK